ncbi:hypothetical protein SNE40_003266 [Patella caerulea]|uniref:L-dopachrome isomerase n=1 Tax=Patella caerulea TaxID=87958 RepID=A0AAN8KAQ2_PATCE
MPSFSLITNLSQGKIPVDFLTQASNLIATALGKPESYVTVRIEADAQMIFGGSNEPCGTAELSSIGRLGIEENKVLAKTIGEFLEKQLGLKQNRVYIRFIDIPRAELGFSGTTFEELLGKK